MASGKYGVKTREWWKHLRWTKRYFWKAHRKQGKKDIKRETSNG